MATPTLATTLASGRRIRLPAWMALIGTIVLTLGASSAWTKEASPPLAPATAKPPIIESKIPTAPDAVAPSATLALLVTQKSEPPFWKLKPALMTKIREERAVIVSVNTSRASSGLQRFTMLGVGVVNRPKAFCFATAQDYGKLKEVSEHFKTVSFDAKTDQLYMVLEALGYEARMTLHVTPASEDWRSELQWVVISGSFTGMKGVIGFEHADHDHTEMSMSSEYEASELPLPRVLMGFALEVITQKVAEKMRTFIEAQPQAAVEAKPGPTD